MFHVWQTVGLKVPSVFGWRLHRGPNLPGCIGESGDSRGGAAICFFFHLVVQWIIDIALPSVFPPVDWVFEN